MSAQLEDGYTRTANELLDHLMKSKFNGTQHSIIYCIIRNTYGFQRKSHAMSLSYIHKAIDAHKDLVKRELDKLIEWKVVKVFKDATFNDPREIGMNNKVEEWSVQSESKGRQSTNQSTVSQLVAEQSTNQSTPTVDQSVYQERKSFKQNSKETINIVPFEEIITYLNNKAGTKFRHNTVNTKKHINARWNENYRLIDFERVIDKKCAEWLGNDMERYLCPDTLFGAKFEKYLNQKILLKGGQQNAKHGTGHAGRTNAELDALSL